VAPFSEAECKRIAAFQEDFARGLREILASLDCIGLPATHTPEDVCLGYTNYKFRRIEARLREVYRSDTLKQRPDLSAEECAAIDALEAKARAGTDLYPHQSTTLRKPLANDGLLSDWRVQHLHLGLATGRPTVAPFVNRSGKVLLVRVTDDALYMIDCLPHGPDVEPPWWNIDLPETIHRNWPESIEHLKLDGYEPKLSWEDHRRLRPARGPTITMAVSTSDGTSYLLSETGMVMTGYSMEACSRADRFQTYVRNIALDRGDDEKLVVLGDHREVHVYVERRS
jgi:hypothetical protein